MCQTLQDTLAYATALLNEKEQSGSSNGSDGSPANENADRSLRQVALNFTLTALKLLTALQQHMLRRREQNWNISLASVRSCKGLPRLLLVVDFIFFLTHAVPVRMPTLHTIVRVVPPQA